MWKKYIRPHIKKHRMSVPADVWSGEINKDSCPAFGSSLLAVESLTSGVADSHGVTGGVYKTRERIHRDILIRDY